MASAEGRRIEAPKALSGMGYAGCPLPRSGERELSSGVPAGNAFWRILKATERSFLHLYADALSSPNVTCVGQGRGWRQLRPSCLNLESRMY